MDSQTLLSRFVSFIELLYGLGLGRLMAVTPTIITTATTITERMSHSFVRPVIIADIESPCPEGRPTLVKVGGGSLVTTSDSGVE